MGGNREAEEDFKKKLELDPDDPENYSIVINLGNIKFREKNYEEALAYYNKAEISQPNDAELLHQKGNALAVLGKYQEAEDYLNKAIDKEPAMSVFRESLAAMYLLKK